MRKIIYFGSIFLMMASCNENNKAAEQAMPLAGTWQLITGTLIDKGDTVITDYTKNLSFIKIITETHFAFLSHDLNKGKSADSAFSAGGGRYSIKDSSYTEHLEYCSDRQWEGNDFKFSISIKNDTLIQTGVEKVQNTGINRLNIEKYIRLKK